MEATSGGDFTRDIWYRQNSRCRAKPLQRTVSISNPHDEEVALIASTLVEHAARKSRRGGSDRAGVVVNFSPSRALPILAESEGIPFLAVL
ncbi:MULTISPECIES: hypothetical protein [unclassified Rhizobium]|uniref:hypothetical protein n=1 Tax=unclassified Rhizobium TaxID=2613769 RepID=UPI000F74616C|nr:MULTISPECIES: hypothetical protein [unclassified Rhizobium]